MSACDLKNTLPARNAAGRLFMTFQAAAVAPETTKKLPGEPERSLTSRAVFEVSHLVRLSLQISKRQAHEVSCRDDSNELLVFCHRKAAELVVGE